MANRHFPLGKPPRTVREREHHYYESTSNDGDRMYPDNGNQRDEADAMAEDESRGRKGPNR